MCPDGHSWRGPAEGVDQRDQPEIDKVHNIRYFLCSVFCRPTEGISRNPRAGAVAPSLAGDESF